MPDPQFIEVYGPLDTVCVMLGSLGATVSQPPVSPQLLALDDHHLTVSGDDPELTVIQIAGPHAESFRGWLLNQLVDLLPYAVRIPPVTGSRDPEPTPTPT